MKFTIEVAEADEPLFDQAQNALAMELKFTAVAATYPIDVYLMRQVAVAIGKGFAGGSGVFTIDRAELARIADQPDD